MQIVVTVLGCCLPWKESSSVGQTVCFPALSVSTARALLPVGQGLAMGGLCCCELDASQMSLAQLKTMLEGDIKK
eukprot:2840780-Amphidinium_carterae.1